MKTDELIRGLAADARPTRSLELGLALSLGSGLVAALGLFALMLAPRAGMPGLLAEPKVLLKFAVTLSLAVAAGVTVLRMVRPGTRAAPVAWLLLIPAALLALGVVAELATAPETGWMPGMMGHYALYCTLLVPTLAAPLLGAALLALRRGAPANPTLAGAVAGLLAGGLGAAVYAMHCIDDSPLFMLVWYGIAVGFVTLLGAVLGRRLLAW